MRKSLSMICCLLLLLSLLAGCSDEEAEPTTQPTKAVSVETSPTEETLPPETTETYPDAELTTTALRDHDAALRKTYVLMAVSSDAPFMAQDVKLNERGTNALVQWIMTADARAIVQAFGTEEFGESLFSLPTDAPEFAGWINTSTPLTETIHLAVESSIADSGLTEALLPVFEEAYNYTVSVTDGSAAAVLNAARSGYADLVLVEAGDLARTLVTDGFARTVPGFEAEALSLCSLQYLLCGPKDDPAGIASCASVGEAFAAIAKGEYTFTSRGDKSNVHRLEQQFWPADQEFGGWYISAEMEMGPCLVLNGIEDGYILTDKLTWLIYAGANGII